MSRKISWNICRAMATSAIWKITWRPWLTTFAPILISLSFRLVSDQSLIGLRRRQRAQEIAEVVGERMKLEPHRIGGRHAVKLALPESSRSKADDRLSLDPFGRVEGGDGIVEGSHGADVCPHSSVTSPPDNLTQLGAIGYDDEVNRPAVSGPRLGRAGDSHQRSSGSNHARRPLRDVAAEDIENQIDAADLFQSVIIEVEELLRAEVESRLTAGSAPGADDIRPGLTCELGCHRTNYAGRTVHKDGLPSTKAAVFEQPLPRGQARHHKGRAHREVNVPRQRREVACLDGHILRQRAVASPVREAEHPLSHRQPRRSIAEGGDHSGQLVARDRRRPVTAETIDPGRGPRQL